MVITSLEEKENRKIWVPIRGGNRGGWSLFDWEKVREMPYRDRQMYLGNSAKIGVLDKGGKWRKKDWYLHKNGFSSGDELTSQMSEAMRRDQERMNAALGISGDQEKQEKLTPAELQALLKKVRGNKEEVMPAQAEAVGLGFDKSKVEIRAKPTTKKDNPHKLYGTGQYEQQKATKVDRNRQEETRKRSRSRSQGRKKKHKKERREDRSKSREKHRKREDRERSESQRKQKHKKSKKHRRRSESRD